MNVKLTSVKLRQHKSIGDVQTVEIVNGKIKIVDIYNDEKYYSASEWTCVCYEYATCCNCGKQFFYNGETCEIYHDEFLCSNCFNDYFGYCNSCGELNKYTDMNEDIVCKGCE